MTIGRLKSMELRAQEADDDETTDRVAGRVHEYLDLLECQMGTPIGVRDWGAFDELAEIALNYNLILETLRVRGATATDGRDREGIWRIVASPTTCGGYVGTSESVLSSGSFECPAIPWC